MSPAIIMKKQKILDRIKVTEEKLEKARQNLNETPLEKSDFTAILLAALISFVLPTLIVIGLVAIIVWFLFFGFPSIF